MKNDDKAEILAGFLDARLLLHRQFQDTLRAARSEFETQTRRSKATRDRSLERNELEYRQSLYSKPVAEYMLRRDMLCEEWKQKAIAVDDIYQEACESFRAEYDIKVEEARREFEEKDEILWRNLAIALRSFYTLSE